MLVRPSSEQSRLPGFNVVVWNCAFGVVVASERERVGVGLRGMLTGASPPAAGRLPHMRPSVTAWFSEL